MTLCRHALKKQKVTFQMMSHEIIVAFCYTPWHMQTNINWVNDADEADVEMWYTTLLQASFSCVWKLQEKTNNHIVLIM